MAKKAANKTPVVSKSTQNTVMDLVIAQIKKKHGNDSICTLGGVQGLHKLRKQLSSGSLTLDLNLGPICKNGDLWQFGFAEGRMIEIFGPESAGKSTIALHIVAACQRKGGVAAYIDAEHTFDPNWAKKLEVNLDTMFFSQPQSGEEGLQIAEDLIKSNGIDVLVIDSVAALLPKCMIDGEIGDQTMGKHGKMMSEALAKFVATKSKTLIVFVNQMRDKVGVMFGCCRGDVVVPFTDGTFATMREIVESRIDKYVWGLNFNTNKLEPARIVNWFHNGKVNSHDDWVHIKSSIPGTRNGISGVVVTPDHKIMTNTGWKEASAVVAGDTLMSQSSVVLNGSLAPFLTGCLIADSHIAKSGKYNGSLVFEDCNNETYVRWKTSKLSAMQFTETKFTTLQGRETFRAKSQPTYEIGDLGRKLNNRMNVECVMEYFDAMSLAVLYMDDGNLYEAPDRRKVNISMKRLRNHPEKGLLIVSKLRSLGVVSSFNPSSGLVLIMVNSHVIFFNLIASMVPDCMQYKLPEQFRGKYVDFNLVNEPANNVAWSPVISVGKATFRHGLLDKYDIEVGGCHSFLAGNSKNGFLIHNSPETTPGGRALKFYTSYRLDVRKGEPIKDNSGCVIGHRMKVKTIKNKLAPPFAVAEFDFLYNLRPDMPAGIDKVAELLDLSVEVGLIVDQSNYYYLTDKDNTSIGHGRRNAIDRIRSDNVLIWNLFNEMMTRKLALRGYNPDLTLIPGVKELPMYSTKFEPPTAEDLANADGQDEPVLETA